MKCTTTGEERMRPVEGCVFDVRSLYAQLEQLNDKRKARGKRYTLALVLTLIVLAKLSGEDRPWGIADWVQLCTAPLREARALTRTQHVPARAARRSRSGATANVGEYISDARYGCRGKCVSRTRRQDATRQVHLLAAYLPAEGIVLMQVAGAGHENEIRAAPQVLKCLDLRGKIVIADALHTQRKLSAQIVKAKGQYIWRVKDNQPQLRQDIEQVFAPEVCVKGFSPTPKDFQHATTIEKGHGRLEQRTLTSSSVLRDYADWPHLQQVFMLQRRITCLKQQTVREEVHYGCTSLSAAQASPARLLQLVRGYWGIENGLHYRRDKSLQEDATRMTTATLAEAMACTSTTWCWA